MYCPLDTIVNFNCQDDFELRIRIVCPTSPFSSFLQSWCLSVKCDVLSSYIRWRDTSSSDFRQSIYEWQPLHCHMQSICMCCIVTAGSVISTLLLRHLTATSCTCIVQLCILATVKTGSTGCSPYCLPLISLLVCHPSPLPFKPRTWAQTLRLCNEVQRFAPEQGEVSVATTRANFWKLH